VVVVAVAADAAAAQDDALAARVSADVVVVHQRPSPPIRALGA
jgi:hypothetical protein